MKSISTLLALLVLFAIPAIAEDSPEQIKEQLQTAYNQSQKALEKNDVEGYMALFADDFSTTVPSGAAITPIGREQVREQANATVKRAKRATTTHLVEKVEFIDVPIEGGSRRDTVATVYQTLENEAVDREGKKVKRSLKLTFRDTVVKQGDSWQIRLREPQ